MIITLMTNRYLSKLYLSKRLVSRFYTTIFLYIIMDCNFATEIPSSSLYRSKLRKLLVNFLMLAILIYNFSSEAKNLTTYSINSPTTADFIKIVDKDTLVLISIDNIILTPKSKIFRTTSPYNSFVEDLINRSLKSPSFITHAANWYKQRQMILVEDGWPEFIEKLKKTGAKVVGLSKLHYKLYSAIKEPELLIYKELNQFNIKFTDKINNLELFKIGSLGGMNSIFYKGIIFTGSFSKAQTIVDFMKVTYNVPKKILVFETRMDYIEQIEDFLKPYDTDYFFVYYLAERDLPGKPLKEAVILQQQQLINAEKWIEDEEAERMVTATTTKQDTPSLSTE